MLSIPSSQVLAAPSTSSLYALCEPFICQNKATVNRRFKYKFCSTKT